jgi:4,5-dihydroxyphthalate decarboxylase
VAADDRSGPGVDVTERLTLAIGDYDRTRPLADGTVRAADVELSVVNLHPGELFARVVRDREFEVAELSLSTYLNLRARGDHRFVAIPVFPSRMFRHGYVFVHAGAGIRRPEDLAGRTIGTEQWQLTAGLWLRGILEDDHGVAPEQMTWVIGGQEEAGSHERAAVDYPAGVRIEPPPGRPLGDLLADGELDALIAPHVPTRFREGDPGIVRLWPDYPAVEAAWYRRTRLFPIMHAVVIRADVAERLPDLAPALFGAFCAAKRIARDRLRFTGTLVAMVPWLIADIEATEALFGDRWWPYGVEANRPELEAAIRYAVRQAIAVRPLSLEELFAPGTLDLVDGA